MSVIDQNDIAVKMDDLDQNLKGTGYNVGQRQGLARKDQRELEQRGNLIRPKATVKNDYNSGSDESDDEEKKQEKLVYEATPQTFFSRQADALKKKNAGDLNRHLYAQEFKDKRNGKPFNDDTDNIPFTHIEIMFNKLNLWVNLQHHDPTKIRFNLHIDQQWLPLNRVTEFPHYSQLFEGGAKAKEYENFKKWYEKSFEPDADDEKRRERFPEKDRNTSKS